MEKQNDLFEEMSVVELEDRLELTARCVCRNKEEQAPEAPAPAPESV